MSTNCLVTKLKGVVNNDTLLYFGALKFRMPIGVEKITLRVISDGDDSVKTIAPIGTKVKILSNGYFKHPTNPTPVYYDDEHIVVNESIAIFPTDNTKPVDFIVYGYNSYSPTGSSNKNDLICCNPTDSLVGYTNIKYLNVSVFDCDVNLNDYKTKLPLGNIVAFIGNITNYRDTVLSDLGAFINATTINIANSNLGGSIESLVEVFRNLGRTDPITDFNFFGSNITYEGSPIGSMGGHYTLSWTENDISLTINN